MSPLATARGARVVGAARGEPKLAAVRAEGAVAAIDYSDPDWTDRVLAALGGARPAVVLDGVGGEIGQAAFAITAEGGVFSARGAASGDFTPLDQDAARERSITVRGISEVQFSSGQRLAVRPERELLTAGDRVGLRQALSRDSTDRIRSLCVSGEEVGWRGGSVRG